MKILHICTYQNGGAAIAANRLHKGLLSLGIDSNFLFLECNPENGILRYENRNWLKEFILKVCVKLRIPLSRSQYRLSRNRRHFELFSHARSIHRQLHRHPAIQEADIINLHWVSGFVDFPSFFTGLDKRVVWTLHDMQPFQGGFHYLGDEIRNRAELQDLDSDQLDIKLEVFKRIRRLSPPTIVAPSVWLKTASESSMLFGGLPHHHIQYGLDISVFKPKTSLLRNELGLTSDKILVLFVSEHIGNFRKGFDMVLEMVKDPAVSQKCQFVAVGVRKGESSDNSIRYLGSIKSEQRISEIYASADIFLIPSREDNLPNTMIESLCCGTPVVGFKVGGILENIEEDRNGWLAPELSCKSLTSALLKGVSRLHKIDRSQVSANAHSAFSSHMQANRYAKLYEQLIAQHVKTDQDADA